MKKLTLLLAALASLAQVAKAAPANDDFADAQVLTGNFPTADGDGSDASREIGEPAGGGTNSVWYKWTAPAYGIAEFGALFTSRYFSYDMQVFVGTALNDLVPIEATTGSSETRSTAVVGKDQTYYIRLADVDKGVEKTFSVFVDFDSNGFEQTYFQGTSWLNNNFSQAATLAGTKAKAIGYPSAATREAGEPTDTWDKTLWWKWTAPSTGTTIFSTVGSEADRYHRITVARGSVVSDLDYVYKEATFGTTGVEIALKTTKGATYYICTGEDRPQASYVVSVTHTTEAATSSGSGTGGRFSTLRRDVLDYTKISGVFSMSGLTGMKIVLPASFTIRSGEFHPTAKTWSFILDKKSTSVSPTSCKIDIICYKAGKQVGKFTKTFRVW